MGKVIVRTLIRNNSTREERWYASDAWEQELIDDGHVAFMFGDGNYSCDCNRALFFARAGSETDPADSACCSGKFTVLRCEAADGTILYKGDADESAKCTPICTSIVTK